MYVYVIKEMSSLGKSAVLSCNTFYITNLSELVTNRIFLSYRVILSFL